MDDPHTPRMLAVERVLDGLIERCIAVGADDLRLATAAFQIGLDFALSDPDAARALVADAERHVARMLGTPLEVVERENRDATKRVVEALRR